MIGTPIALVDMARDVALDLTDDEKVALAVEIVLTVGPGGNGPTLRQAARKIEQHAHALGRGGESRRSDGIPQGHTTSPRALAIPPEGSHPSGTFPHKRPRPQLPSWRGMPRISIPGVLISRAVGAITTPLVLAGPETAKRLQPYAERLCGISCPSRWQRLQRVVMLWLLEEPGSAPEAIEDDLPPGPAWLIDGLGALGLPPEKQRRPSGDQEGEEPHPPIGHQETPQFPDAPPRRKSQGVR